MPTFKRLKAKNDTAVMMWFQNGKLWPSRIDAQEAMIAARRDGPARRRASSGSRIRDRERTDPTREAASNARPGPRAVNPPRPRRRVTPTTSSIGNRRANSFPRPSELIEPSDPRDPSGSRRLHSIAIASPTGSPSPQAVKPDGNQARVRLRSPSGNPRAHSLPASSTDPRAPDWKPDFEQAPRTVVEAQVAAEAIARLEAEVAPRSPTGNPKAPSIAEEQPAVVQATGLQSQAADDIALSEAGVEAEGLIRSRTQARWIGKPDWKPRGSFDRERKPARKPRSSEAERPEWTPQGRVTPSDLRTEKRKWVPKEEYKKSMGIEAKRDSKWRPGRRAQGSASEVQGREESEVDEVQEEHSRPLGRQRGRSRRDLARRPVPPARQLSRRDERAALIESLKARRHRHPLHQAHDDRHAHPAQSSWL